jgi:D-glycero-D-manno-heptose 1,7-bisphosphate phosphatase
LLKKVVFLDRDGTINRDSPEYIKSWEEFEFIPGSIEAIRNLSQNGFTSIVITNQSALPRRLISRQELEHIHSMMQDTIELNGGKIADIFFCPHMPDAMCACRKPQPGLIIQAQGKYNIDLADAVMIGDHAKDIECAHGAGCGKAVLVKTGRTHGVEQALRAKHISPDHVAKNLFEAAEWIIANKT